MAVLDRNELFFTALKIAVAQEKNPYWIFKTNLLHIDNIATTIHSDNLIRPSIDLDSIYEYIDEALPFHDRFENYAIQYSKNDEICNVDFEEERTLTIQIGYENVTEYPTTVGYDSLPYDFEYPGIGLSGSDYESLGYNPDFGYEDIEDHPIISTQVSGWYPFKNPVNRDITQGRNRTGSIQEDPLGALYDYQPSYQQFQNVLSAYNANKSFGNPNYQDIDIKDLIIKYYNDPYYFDNTANFLYILNQDKTFDWVRDTLFNNFKGLQVHGGKNGGDSNGYDSNSYDSNLYDYITFENKYYITDEEPAEWFLVESTKYNINQVIPTNTVRFYTPEAPFATKKLEVYLTEPSTINNFNILGNSYVEDNYLYNFQSSDSYAALRNLFEPGFNAWEITVNVRINQNLPIIPEQPELYPNKVTPIFGNQQYDYVVPQLYIIGDTVYFKVSTNGNLYDVELELSGIQENNIYTFTVGYDREKYYLKVDGLGEVSQDLRTPIYTNTKSILRIGNANYDYTLVNYIPKHYIGGVYSYRGNDLPYISSIIEDGEEQSIVYVPALVVIYSEGLDENQIQKLAIGNTQGNQEIITYLTIGESTKLFLKVTTTNSNILIPDRFTQGLLTYIGGNIFLEENTRYLGKFSYAPSPDTYPAYYFNINDDRFYKKTSANSNWVMQSQFTIIGEVRTSATGSLYVNNYPSFELSPDIRYLYQSAEIDLLSFRADINGYMQAPINNGEKHLKLNRDYTIGVDADGKEYITLIDENKQPITLDKDSVLRIDCLDYDYLYDVIYATKETSSHEFQSYRTFLGSFPSVEAIIQRYGSIKVKYRDYFYNTTTGTEWVFNPINMDLTLDVNPQDYEIEITLENVQLEIYEVLGVQFGWGDTGMPYGSIKENDLFNLRGTKLLRPENTAKGSEEIRTGVRDGVIIDIYESAANIDSTTDIMIAPHTYSESISMGKNKELKIEPFTNEGILKFVNGRYEDVSLKWKSRTAENPWPNTYLNVLTDVSSTNTRFIEIEKDILEIMEEKHLYGQTSNIIEIEFDNIVDSDLFRLVIDGKMLEKDTDYTITINNHTVSIEITSNIISDGKKHCYSLYLMKSNNYSQVYKQAYEENPYTIVLPNSYLNPAVLNTFMLFDSKGNKLQAPYMKWWYLESGASEFELPINSMKGIDITDVQVWLGFGNDVRQQFKIRQSQYSIQDNKLIFPRELPSGVTLSVIIPTDKSYTVYFRYDNGNYLVDYDLEYVIDYESRRITDYGHYEPDVTGEAIIYVEPNLDAKTLVFIGNALKYNFRLDSYQIKENNVYTINFPYVDNNSICVWRNGLLLDNNDYMVYNGQVTLFSQLTSQNDNIQIWYKINRSVNAYQHDKIVLSDTNLIYDFKNIPMSRVSLVYPFGYNDIKMYVDNANYLTQPYIEPRNIHKGNPGRIQIGNEILEFWSVDLNDKIPGTETPCHSLSGFVRGILGSSDASSTEAYPVGTLIQDIGVRYESLITHTKNKNSRIEYMTVRENWEDPDPKYGRKSLMPWYNIPGEVLSPDDIKVWKTEWIKVAKDYKPEDNYITLERTDSIITPSPYIFKSQVGNYTYDYNQPIEHEGNYYKTGIINDSIGIRLYNSYMEYSTNLFTVNGDLQTVVNTINANVDNDIMTCRVIQEEELDNDSYLQFTLNNGYSMEIYDNTDPTAQSYFVQEIFGGIMKSTVDVSDVELIVDNGNGIAIEGYDKNIYNIQFRFVDGKTVVETLVDDINAISDKTRVSATIKTNTNAGNISQLYLINYARTDALITNIVGYNNFEVLGISGRLIGCPVINEDGTGRITVINTNKGKFAVDNKFYEYSSVIENSDEAGEYTNLTDISIPREIKAGEEFLGSKFILQEFEKDYLIENNAVKFFERQKIGTILRIQNKDILIEADNNLSHNHFEA